MADDWGVTFYGVMHLRLEDSRVAGVPLSTTASHSNIYMGSHWMVDPLLRYLHHAMVCMVPYMCTVSAVRTSVV
ncbi:hypothetical protein TSOC_005929 [Tetrabaena socialis]|uniref:Uncharacterized protein n=1 Tax=Tetrabaena socialis TaxID=47790 RepID=A0A2J8A4Y0_9CHLO|nr:hypothetical protein TSOC_005929 [Tetrabaena socialis]|eukprot:PNH07584.1 hypothetical protein TSOC_005929 [Tetrabaena socialis]